jgi:hypothetical protein
MRATSGDWNWTRDPMLLHARRTILACHSCSTARISDPPATGDAFRMPGAEAVHELSMLDTSTTTICPNGRGHHVPAAHTYQRGRNHGGCSESPLTKLVSPRKRLCTKVAALVSPWNLMTRGASADVVAPPWSSRSSGMRQGGPGEPRLRPVPPGRVSVRFSRHGVWAYAHTVRGKH